MEGFDLSDRVHSLTVVLDRDMREEDVGTIMQAIAQLRHVVSVGGNVASPADYVAMERARYELGRKVVAAVYPERKP